MVGRSGTYLDGETPNSIAFPGPSSFTTMAAFNTAVLCNRLLIFQGNRYARNVDELPLVPFQLAPSREVLFHPPLTADDHLLMRTKPLLRFPLVPTRLGKTASASAVVSTESGDPSWITQDAGSLGTSVQAARSSLSFPHSVNPPPRFGGRPDL